LHFSGPAGNVPKRRTTEDAKRNTGHSETRNRTISADLTSCCRPVAKMLHSARRPTENRRFRNRPGRSVDEVSHGTARMASRNRSRPDYPGV
jgi:hypothetical protein